jgi:hypothetical protein
VRRQFKAARPGHLHVADFTYVPLAGGRFACTAFVVGAFAGLIPGEECSLSKQAAFVERRSARALDLDAISDGLKVAHRFVPRPCCNVWHPS